jgi:type I restriction enzyme S subunit
MKSYENYKTTDITWYPEIPKNWDYCKVKHVANTYAGGTPSTVVESYWEKGEIPWLPSGKLQNCEITTAEKFISEDGLINSSAKWIKPNTVLIALTGATCANIGYLTFQACANQSVVAIDENLSKANSRYLYYMFLNMRSQILTHQTGGAQAGVNDGDVKNLYLLKPSVQEQTQIATFLDYKTNLIDAIIEKKKQLITLLKEKRQAVINEAVTKGLNPIAKMKNSGVDWLGEVPKDWEISYFKHYISLKGRLGWKGLKAEEYVEGSGYGFLSTPDIKFEKIDFKKINNITKERYLESPEIMLEINDVLLVKDGSTLGITNIIKELPTFCTVNSSIGVLKVYDQNIVSPTYLLLYLRTSYIQSVINLLKAGQGVPHLFQKDINNFTLIVPSIFEQTTIINFVENKNNKINTLIQNISNQIENLQTYRQSLISEAVTGKIDVRDWQPPKK